MSSILRLDRPASVGTSDFSRDDAAVTEVITISSMGPGTLHELSIFDHWPPPPGTPGAPVTMVTPTINDVATVGGAYRSWTIAMPNLTFVKVGFKLLVDGVETRRTVAILATVGGYSVAPVLYGETGDPKATIATFGTAAAISRSTDNSGSNARGWATRTNALFESVRTSVGAAVPSSRTITTTTPLRIDGGASADLSANRTLSILAATGAAAGSMSAVGR